MSQIRKMAVAGGTFSVALSIGFVMQNGDALAARMGGAVPPVATTPQLPSLQLPSLPAVAQSRLFPMPSVAQTTPVVEAEFIAPDDLSAPALPRASVEMAALDIAEIADTDVTPAPQAEIQQIVLAPLDENFIGPLMPDQVRIQSTDSDTASAVVPSATTQTTADQPLLANAGCDAVLSGQAAPAGSVDLRLSAPCAPNTTVTFHHQGMIWSMATDASGMAEVTAPALSETAVFIADIGGQEGAVTVLTVPDVAMYDRSVVQWQGETGLEMHAREFGADYDEAGHVSLASMRDTSMAMSGEGGFLVALGDARLDGAMMAQVYTYPSSNSVSSGLVEMSVEAEVTAANCGREIAAQTIQVTGGAEPFARDLEMTLPACDAVGEFLVLNNMLTDLTLASR